MTFVSRKIDVTINIGQGQLGDDAGQKVTLSGYRMSASIGVYGGQGQGQLSLRVFGLPLSLMNQLTRVAPFVNVQRNNTIVVTVGESQTVMYSGIINSAYGDFNAAPDVCLTIAATSGAMLISKPCPPHSYRGAISADTVLSDFATLGGFQYESSGVNAQLTDLYTEGSLFDQIKHVCDAASLNFDTSSNILSVWPKTGAQAQLPVLEFSPDTGSIGYPTFSSDSIIFTHELIPSIRIGQKLNVTSSLPVANATWIAWTIAHVFECYTPNGAWYTQVSCARKADDNAQ